MKVCTCLNGYRGDGNNCEDVDECATINDCKANTACQNSIGSFECACIDGFEGEHPRKEDCVDIKECEVGFNGADACNKLGSNLGH